MAQVKERGGSRFISRAAKTENPVPRSFFAPKPNGNACYAGYNNTITCDAHRPGSCQPDKSG